MIGQCSNLLLCRQCDYLYKRRFLRSKKGNHLVVQRVLPGCTEHPSVATSDLNGTCIPASRNCCRTNKSVFFYQRVTIAMFGVFEPIFTQIHSFVSAPWHWQFRPKPTGRRLKNETKLKNNKSKCGSIACSANLLWPQSAATITIGGL